MNTRVVFLASVMLAGRRLYPAAKRRFHPNAQIDERSVLTS